MNRSVVLLAFATGMVFGQTLTPREPASPVTTRLVDRLPPLPKPSPPEVIVPAAYPGRASILRSFCVYPSLDTNSLSVKPCRADPRKLRLIPRLENIEPLAKPTTPPGNIR